MKRLLLFLAGLFCYQHLLRDRLQDEGVRNWYTTFGHFGGNNPTYNHIGMVIFFVVGTFCFYLACKRRPNEA